jgi:hypothetical protein
VIRKRCGQYSQRMGRGRRLTSRQNQQQKLSLVDDFGQRDNAGRNRVGMQEGRAVTGQNPGPKERK